MIGSMGIRLRPLQYEDWPAVHDWARLLDSCRYQAWGPNTEAETQAYVREAARLWHQLPQTSFPHAVLTGEIVVGVGDLHLRGSGQGEIGYGIHPRAWGRGLATAVGQELLRIAFEQHGLHRVYATCDPRNVASARVLAKIGMTHEGRMRETALIRDGWRDSDLFAILVHEWERCRASDARGPRTDGPA
jgi:ribosomal-protein-alanine N-acetyltransferase